MEMLLEFIKDALFSAMAAIGFGAISRIPRRAYLWCGLIAALGHSARFLLMNPDIFNLPVIAATGIAAILIGIMAVFASPLAKTPAETYLFPSLLPMIPGIYAYKTFGAIAMMAMAGNSEERFNYYFYQFADNGLITLAILFAMVIGATIPIFTFKSTAFTATR